MKFYLSKIKSKEDLKKLFIEDWNWEPPKTTELYLDFPEEIRAKIKESSVLAERLNYKIYFFNLNNLEKTERELKSIERKIINNSKFKKDAENNIFIFSVHNFEYLDFVKPEKLATRLRLKRFFISPENRDKLRTPSEQLEKLKLDPKQITFSYIKNKIEEAFSVEAVTEKFYKEYTDVFQKIKEVLNRQKVKIDKGKKEEKLRDFIHKILNRIMFLYFVQKRGCFGGDKNFLANFWDAYKSNFKGENKFHNEWLNTLFFEALSKPRWLYQGTSSLGKFNEILKNAPYLNGGLFERDRELDDIGWQIPDDLFDDIFEFFEGYNFTIEESTPFDIEIAINPEMLGNIYEHLVNVEEREEQAKAGIFYTPKVEIELMIRRALVEFLFNKTKIDKEKLYQFVFPDIEEEIGNPFTKDEAEKILKELEEIFILDPACGSGHYLVVTAQILYELKEKLWENLKKPHLNKYEEKKKIIERNIYGNDIKKWAVEVAKLRLWLDLFVDAEDELLRNQIEPLLPNLNFKIRYGDSLVQRVGNEIIPLRNIKSIIKSQREALKSLFQKKEYVYKTSDPDEYKNTLYLEKKVLWDALERKKIETQQKIQLINSQIQFNLFEETLKNKQNPLFEEKLREKAFLETTLKGIENFIEELKKEKETRMLWDLAFAEVFQIKNGFDIVIANPPYVRQELIEDLTGFYSKKEYKEKLIQQIKQDWSYDYDGKPIKSPIPEKFDKKCDLYVYFYLKGLKLLNPDGVLCYISSNSWLDVGFGRVLQEVLLKRCPIVVIYDNQAKRSFKHADVNTIIAVIKAPKTQDFDKEIKENNVQFVMFKKPFDEVMYSKIFIDLEKNETLKQLPEGKRRENEIYRLHIVNQKDLYEFGRDKQTGKYTGNKWGGKYLRAPEIYWIILEKGKDKLVRLGDIAEIRRGFTTGANEFFYVEDVTDKIEEISEIKHKIKNLGEFKSLEEIKKAGLRIVRNTKTGDYWLIEEEFLKPVIKSPRECKSILIKPEDLKYKVLMVHKSKKELKGKKVLDYIEWGESQGFHKIPTVSGRKYWYEIKAEGAKILALRATSDKPYFYISSYKILSDQTFYFVKPRTQLTLYQSMIIFNNSITNYLSREILSGAHSALGLGALWTTVDELHQLNTLDPNLLENLKIEVFINKSYSPMSVFQELGFDPSKPIREQEPNPLPDRKALDDIVFDALGLTEEERKEVYWSVAELVKNRLEKAKSV